MTKKTLSLLLLFVSITFMIASCDKEETKDITLKYPKITTKSAHTITTNSAIAGGTITDAGASSVTAKGVCWATTANPTISGFHTDHGGGNDDFNSQIANLQPGTKYYLRAYATNQYGTGYGKEMVFTTNQ